jgi:hypothetical protein
MALDPRLLVTATNQPPVVPSPETAEIGFLSTASGPALLVALTGAPIVVAVNLDLADDEVAIGGPDSGGTRRLFQGRVEGANNVIENVPRMIGAQADALGKAEDTAAAGGDVGVPAYSVRRDSDAVVGVADGDYTPLHTNATGRLKVIVNGTVAVAPTVIPGTAATNLGKAEDAVAAAGDTGVFALAVRRDADGPQAGDGDYTELQVDASGRLKVDGGGAGGGVHAEDSVAASGANGVFALGVRRDADAPTAGDGDYSELQTDANGRLKTAQLSEHAEDTAHTTGDVGVQALAVRNDTPGSLAGTDGDYAPLQVDSAGRLATVAVPGPLLSTSISVPTAVAAVSVLLLAAAANRRTLLIRNSGAGPLYVAPRTPAVTTDILIASGETLEINGLWAQSAWYAISNGVGATATTYAGLVAT